MIDYSNPVSTPQPIHRGAASVARSFSSVMGWAFGAILFLGLVGGALSPLFWDVSFGAAGAALVLVLILVAGQSRYNLRRTRSRIILSYLLQVVHLRLPLAPMLKAAADGELHGTAKRLYRVRTAIEDGSPVGDALLSGVPQTPQRIVDLVNAGERNGCLERVLQDLSDESSRTAAFQDVPAFFKAYGLLLFASVGAVVALIDTFVMPKFQQIFLDFHTDPPAAMNLVIGFGIFIAPLVAICALVWLIVTTGNAMRELFTPARPRGSFFRVLIDPIIWITPFFGTLTRDHGLADALGVSANAMEAGRPADQAIQEGAMPHLNTVLRSRIEQWAEGTRQGKLLHEAAAHAGMPSLLVGMLASGAHTGNLPAAIRFLQRYYAVRFSRVVLLIRGAAIPFLVLIVGTVVLMTALGIFGPMIALIETVSAPRHTW